MPNQVVRWGGAIGCPEQATRVEWGGSYRLLSLSRLPPLPPCAFFG